MVAPHDTGDCIRSLVRVPDTGWNKTQMPFLLNFSRVSSYAATVNVPNYIPPALVYNTPSLIEEPQNICDKLIIKQNPLGRRPVNVELSNESNYPLTRDISSGNVNNGSDMDPPNLSRTSSSSSSSLSGTSLNNGSNTDKQSMTLNHSPTSSSSSSLASKVSMSNQIPSKKRTLLEEQTTRNISQESDADCNPPPKKRQQQMYNMVILFAKQAEQDHQSTSEIKVRKSENQALKSENEVLKLKIKVLNSQIQEKQALKSKLQLLKEENNCLNKRVLLFQQLFRDEKRLKTVIQKLNFKI